MGLSLKTNTMKNFNFLILIVILISFSDLSCAQKFEKPPKNNKNILIDKKPIRLINVINNSSQLSINNEGLYCYKIKDGCNIIDGETTIFSYYQTSGGDTPTSVPYTYAKGEFLDGKYQGKWVFYDKKGRVIKKENWNKGILTSKKEYSFNQCNLKEEYKLSRNDNDVDYNSIEQFKKDFFVKNGKLSCSSGIINQMRLFYRNIDSYEFININKGLLKGHEIDVKDAPVGMGDYAILYKYDKEGNLGGIFFTGEEIHKFIKGTGRYIEYYTPVFNVQSRKYEPLIIKGEGEIKNNFKFGEWKYYNKEGKIDSIKTYSLKDSVDVRFPHCIFNKKEPCYCEKK